MTNLNNEITAIIWGTTDKDASIVAEKITKLFEKRIDDLKQHLEELKNPKDNIDPLKDYHCYDACIRTLDKLKELLS